MTKEKRKEIKETFLSLEKMFSQKDAVKSIVTTPEFLEVLEKARSCSRELWREDFPFDENLRFDIENAIEAVDSCCFAVRHGVVDKLQEFYDKALRKLSTVNGRLKGW